VGNLLQGMNAACKGKKFGHNFPVAGGHCLNCGISQKELSEELKPKKLRGIHSEIHALAKDISEHCKEPKKFALYLGIIKRIGKNRTYQIFSEIKQSKTIKSPAKMFMYLSKNNMILKIQKGENNPILRKKSQPIKLTLTQRGRKINDDIRKLAKDMLETMNKNNGIGLSACQVGKNIRLFIVPKELSKKYVFINPKIITISKKTDVMEEGCLSLPGLFLPIKRATSLKIKALNEDGKEFKLKAKGLLACVIQHENDHLNGILIIDKYEKN